MLALHHQLYGAAKLPEPPCCPFATFYFLLRHDNTPASLVTYLYSASLRLPRRLPTIIFHPTNPALHESSPSPHLYDLVNSLVSSPSTHSYRLLFSHMPNFFPCAVMASPTTSIPCICYSKWPPSESVSSLFVSGATSPCTLHLPACLPRPPSQARQTK